MKIKNKTSRVFAEKMKPIDTHSRLYIKKIFPEGDIIFELKIWFEFFRLKYKTLLQKVGNHRQDGNTTQDIVNKYGQVRLVLIQEVSPAKLLTGGHKP